MEIDLSGDERKDLDARAFGLILADENGRPKARNSAFRGIGNGGGKGRGGATAGRGPRRLLRGARPGFGGLPWLPASHCSAATRRGPAGEVRAFGPGPGDVPEGPAPFRGFSRGH